MVFDLLLLSAAILLNGRVALAQDGTPCQTVSMQSVAFMSYYPSATAALVDADVAEECLKSVPVDVDEDKALIEELKLYLNWQSNLAYFKDPPQGYTEERVDILDEMQKISDGLDKGTYKDEYSAMFDLSMVWTKTYDFHTKFAADILNVLQFRRGNIGRGLEDDFAIVSVSTDGKAMPKLYNYYDILYSAAEGWTPSVITEINNKSAEDYVQKWSDQFVFHEDHARYNHLFPSQPGISMGQPLNQFGRSNIPDGFYTTVKHENGTVNQYINSAVIGLNLFDDIEDGESFFAKFCNQMPSQDQNQKRGLPGWDPLQRRDATKVKRQGTAEPSATGYPTPQYLHTEGVIGGYYLSGKGYEDVAVLSIPSFMPVQEEGAPEFQNLVGAFLKDAVDAKKKKLVIDLRGNTGGRVFLGYDVFKQLFPSEEPYGASQFRANEAFDVAGQLMNKALSEFTYEEAIQDYELNGFQIDGLAFAWQSLFNYRIRLTTDNKNFSSFEEYFGPHERNGDKFTTVSRFDLYNYFSDDLNLDITGYRTREKDLNKNQPFEAKDIVLLQDGACGSTCAVFSEFMKTQGGVQQVVFGGKPEKGVMQGVAGSKGSQVYSFTRIHQEASNTYSFVGVDQEELNKTEVGSLVFAQRPLFRSAYTGQGETFSNINLRDNIRMNDSSITPLEFVYEAADCRVFYTAEMIRDVEAVWRKTVDAHWGDAKSVCVEDSTNDKTSLSGGAPTSGNGKKSAAARVGSLSGALMAAVVAVAGLFVIL